MEKSKKSAATKSTIRGFEKAKAIYLALGGSESLLNEAVFEGKNLEPNERRWIRDATVHDGDVEAFLNAANERYGNHPAFKFIQNLTEQDDRRIFWHEDSEHYFHPIDFSMVPVIIAFHKKYGIEVGCNCIGHKIGPEESPDRFFFSFKINTDEYVRKSEEVSEQTYIDIGKAWHELGQSVSFSFIIRNDKSDGSEYIDMNMCLESYYNEDILGECDDKEAAMVFDRFALGVLSAYLDIELKELIFVRRWSRPNSNKLKIHKPRSVAVLVIKDRYRHSYIYDTNACASPGDKLLAAIFGREHQRPSEDESNS